MGAIDAMASETRRVLFEVMLHVAWADRELVAEEREAAQAASIALGLVLPPDRALTSPERRPTALDELPVENLSDRERRLIYVCAAWMALADAVEEPRETAFLLRLRQRLHLSDGDARKLKEQALRIAAELPSERGSWWHAFDRLVVDVARALEAGET